MFDAGPFRVRKYESVVTWLRTRAEVVSEQQKAGLLDSRPCCWLMVNSTCARLGCMRVPLVEGTPQSQKLREEYDIPCQSYEEVGGQPARRVTVIGPLTYIYMCPHTYTYILTHIYTCIYILIHPHIYIHTHIHIYFTHIYIYKHTHTYPYLYIHSYTYPHIYIYTYTCICIYKYIYIYIYIRTQTHIYTYMHLHSPGVTPLNDATKPKAQSSNAPFHQNVANETFEL